MIKQKVAILVLLVLTLSACTAQPQETSAPTETTAPTQPTEATKSTEPTQPTESPTQPTEPPTDPTTETTAPKEIPLTVFSTPPLTPNSPPDVFQVDYTVCQLTIPENMYTQYEWPHKSFIYTERQLNETISTWTGYSFDMSVTTSVCPKSMQDVIAKLTQNEKFFESNALCIILVTNPKDKLPKIINVESYDITAFGGGTKQVQFNVYIEAEPPVANSPVYAMIFKLPLSGYGLSLPAAYGDLNAFMGAYYTYMFTSATQPTEPPTQPTEPPKLTVLDNTPGEPMIPPVELTCEYRICNVGMSYDCRLDTYWGISYADYNEESHKQNYNSRVRENVDFSVKTAVCPKSYDELYAQFVDSTFYDDYVLVSIPVINPEGVLPKIEKIEFRQENVKPFPGWFVRIYVEAQQPNLTDPVYYILVKVPKVINGVTMIDGAQVGGYSACFTYLNQPTEPPTQPTEPPKLNVKERVPLEPLTTPILLDCDYKISIIDMPYEERLERWWGGSTTLTSLEHANRYTKMYEGRGCDLTVKNALCPQSYTEIRDIFVDEVNVPNEEFFKDYALVEILVTNPEGVLPKIEKIEFCKECVDPMDGWYVRIYVDAEPPSLTDPVYSIWVKVPWTINGIKMEPGAQVGGHYFVYTYLLP